MNVRRGGLGRGLGALIPTATGTGTGMGARFEEVPVDLIDPNPRQPREVFDEDAMAELVTSIREVGVLQPVVVREVDGGRYQLIMGERRFRASKLVGLDHVPAIVRDTADDDLLRDALLENLHRQQLNPLEEAAAYQQLLQEFGATHEELADRIGRSRSHVSNTLRLMNLPGAVQRRVAAGVISAGHARALLALDDPDQQEQLASRIVAEGLSVRAVEELVTAPTQPTTRRVRAATERSAALGEVERRLAEHLDTRVRVEMGRRRGKVVIEFADESDLKRIAGLIHLPDGGPTSSLTGTHGDAERTPGWPDAGNQAAGAQPTEWSDPQVDGGAAADAAGGSDEPSADDGQSDPAHEHATGDQAESHADSGQPDEGAYEESPHDDSPHDDSPHDDGWRDEGRQEEHGHGEWHG